MDRRLSHGFLVVRSDALTPQQFLVELPSQRREIVIAIREAVLEALPEGYEEAMAWGMLTYQVPLSRYPDTYNGKALAYAALASQKNYVSLHLMSVYGDQATEDWFHDRYRASGKKLNMGKSCVRFRNLDDVPLDVIGDVIARTSVEQFLARYESARKA